MKDLDKIIEVPTSENSLISKKRKGRGKGKKTLEKEAKEKEAVLLKEKNKFQEIDPTKAQIKKNGADLKKRSDQARKNVQEIIEDFELKINLEESKLNKKDPEKIFQLKKLSAIYKTIYDDIEK